MKNGNSILVWVVALAIPIAAVFVLVMTSLVGGSAGGTLATGRSIWTQSDCIRLSSELRGDTATIKTGGKTIVVGPTNILIDGTSVATINESISDVKVHVKNGAVSFVVDGRPMVTSRR